MCTVYLNGHTLLALPVVLGDLAAVLVDIWRECQLLQEVFWKLARPESGNLSKANELVSVLKLRNGSLRSDDHVEIEQDGVALRTSLERVRTLLSSASNPRCTCAEVTLANTMAEMADWCLEHLHIVLAWRGVGRVSKGTKGDLRRVMAAVKEVRDRLPGEVDVEAMLKV